MRFARRRIYALSMKGLHGFQTTEQMVRELRRAGFDCFVVLERRNILRWLVSAEFGTRFQTWHIRSSEKPTLRTVDIPLHYSGGLTLSDRLQAVESWHTQLRTCLAGSPVLNLTYEDHILPTPVNGYSRICSFIDIEMKGASIGHGVVNPFPLRDMIRNFEEIKERLGGSKFEWMLDE